MSLFSGWFTPKETNRDTVIENLDVSIRGNEVTVTAALYNKGTTTEEVKAYLYIGGDLVDTEPSWSWKNIAGHGRDTIKLSSHWKTGNIEGALSGKVILREQHLGLLDEETFSLGFSGIWAWIKGLGWKTIALIGIVAVVFLAITAAMKTPQGKLAENE